ncbi:MAG: 1-acyl-sn-glycerol-3-phosphate acyltransferase [Verrucomicrobia bacterium]|nr:1-acyl-sn-glycerol-3-phosphate acyltransferase [Verrucomicrobiota bacterium]
MQQPPRLLLILINRFCWLMACLTLGVFFRIERRGRANLPRTGGVLVISNHISWFDPPLLNLALRRIPHWLAMVELFKPGFWQWFFTNGGVIPVDRNDPGIGPVKEAIHRLRTGGVLVLFPEGGIREEPNSILGGNPEFKPGAALIALKAGVPIVPAIIQNARAIYRKQNWFFRRQTIRLTLGEPFQLQPRGDREDAAALMREKLLALAAEVKKLPLP